MTTTILSIEIHPTSGMRLKYPSPQTPTCCFCERIKNDDDTPLLEVPSGITQGIITFPIYYCFECAGDGKLAHIEEIIILLMSQSNSFLMIHFYGHIISNPPELYVPCLGPSRNLQFLCWGKKCHMFIDCDSLFNSIIRGCVIDPQSGAIEKKNVFIRDILLGIRELSNEHPFLKKLIEFDGRYPDFLISEAIAGLPIGAYLGPRIEYVSANCPKFFFELFSLINTGFYSKDAIDFFFSHSPTKNIIEQFIWKCLILMTDYMKKNGADLPDLMQFEPDSQIDEFLTQHHSRPGFPFITDDVLCVNFTIFLKLIRKMIRLLHQFDDETASLDMFQYSKYLYSMIYVIYQNRFVRDGISHESLRRYTEYTERFKIIIDCSPFCNYIFQKTEESTDPVESADLVESVDSVEFVESADPADPKKKIDVCIICRIKTACVIGRCDVHNVSCYGCFSGVLENCKKCPSCRKDNFLP